MNNLFSTKYANIERTVSGTYNVDPEDCILLCDTSSAPVTINLATIFSGKWNTIYKLYVVDNSNNAASNNITIVAGNGQTINGASSVIVNVSAGRVIVRISSDTTYNAQTSWQSATPSGHIIQDEGVDLPQESKLNFKGFGITASDDPGNNRTNVDVPGLTIQDEGVDLPQEAKLNFIGSEVRVVDDSGNGRTNVTIGVTGNQISAVKASSFTPDVRIPSIPVTTGQSWMIDNSSSVIFTDWKQTASSLGGFNPTTGGWTVPTTGFYNVRIRLIIGAYNDGVTGITSNSQLEEGDFGRGTFLLCFINPTTNAMPFFYEFAAYGTSPAYTGTSNTIRTSVIAIDETVLRSSFTAGDEYFVKVLNKTELGYLITPDNSVSVHQSLTLIISETT